MNHHDEKTSWMVVVSLQLFGSNGYGTENLTWADAAAHLPELGGLSAVRSSERKTCFSIDMRIGLVGFHHDECKYLGVSKNRGTPKSSILIGYNRVFHYKPSILGYPPFLETPI